MFSIGPYRIDSHTILAPMAGVTDQPFRNLCKHLGAGLAVSEMVTCDPSLWKARKSQLRLNHNNEAGPISVQIVGGDADMMAQAAHFNWQNGAQIIDINMGCPAKKVCNKAAGSALLRDEACVADILQACVNAVSIPVTLKIRTGWDTTSRNAVTIAKMAEDIGIQALAVHGRTRACAFRGNAEYDTIAEVANAVSIPVFANGDIDSPQKAKEVLEYTDAAAVMIGRAAQGNPWIFKQIDHHIATGKLLSRPSLETIKQTLLKHHQQLLDFYGDYMGIRIARKHLGWYLRCQDNCKEFIAAFNRIEKPCEQVAAIESFFIGQAA